MQQFALSVNIVATGKHCSATATAAAAFAHTHGLVLINQQYARLCVHIKRHRLNRVFVSRNATCIALEFDAEMPGLGNRQWRPGGGIGFKRAVPRIKTLHRPAVFQQSRMRFLQA